MTRFEKFARPSFVLPVVLALLIVGSFMQREFGHYTNRDVDFFAYFFAARAIHDNPKGDLYFGALNGNPESHTDAPPGSEIYEKAEAAGVHEVMFYLYPPILADLLVPISRLPPRPAAILWRVFNLGLVFLSIVALSRMLRIRFLSAEFGILTVAAFCFFPVYEAVMIGQITVVLLALWTLSVVSYSKGEIALSACVLALATALKLTPLLVVPIFLIWRDRKWLAWYSAALALLIVAMGVFNGWQTLETNVKVIAAVGGSVPVMANKTISGLLAWLYYGRFVAMDTGEGLNPPHLLIVAGKVAGLGYYLVCLFLVWRQRLVQGSSGRITAFAIFAMVTPLISPLSWRHAYTIALVPLIILWVQALRTAVPPLHVALLALSTLAMGTLIFDLVALSHVPNLVQIASAGVLAVSAAALCIETLGRPVNEGRSPVGSGA